MNKEELLKLKKEAIPILVALRQGKQVTKEEREKLSAYYKARDEAYAIPPKKAHFYVTLDLRKYVELNQTIDDKTLKELKNHVKTYAKKLIKTMSENAKKEGKTELKMPNFSTKREEMRKKKEERQKKIAEIKAQIQALRKLKETL